MGGVGKGVLAALSLRPRSEGGQRELVGPFGRFDPQQVVLAVFEGHAQVGRGLHGILARQVQKGPKVRVLRHQEQAAGLEIARYMVEDLGLQRDSVGRGGEVEAFRVQRSHHAFKPALICGNGSGARWRRFLCPDNRQGEHETGDRSQNSAHR